MKNLKKERVEIIKKNIHKPLTDMLNNYNITKYFNNAKDIRGAMRKCMAREGYRVENGYFELIQREINSIEPVELVVEPIIEKKPLKVVNDDFKLSLKQELSSPFFTQFIEDIVKSKIEDKVNELKKSTNESNYINTDLDSEYETDIITKTIRINKKAFYKVVDAIEKNPYTKNLTKTKAMTILYLKLAEILD